MDISWDSIKEIGLWELKVKFNPLFKIPLTLIIEKTALNLFREARGTGVSQ